jgi:hypothetical protein
MLDWSKYITVANRLQRRARAEDREDLNHTIVLSLAQAQDRLDSDGGGQLSDIAMLRIASYECQKYWRQMKRQFTILSLNTVTGSDGDSAELIDTVADDKAIDLEAWQDARTWLLGCPVRLVTIADKRLHGEALTNKEHQYLWRFRQREQKVLV